MRTPKVGDKIFVKTIPAYKKGNTGNKYCIIESILLDTIFCRPKSSRNKQIDVSIDDIEFVESEKVVEDKLTREDRANIVRRLVMEETLKEDGQFVRELQFLGKLIKQYPSVKFWRNFNPSFQVRTCLWWLGNGRDQMRVFWNKEMLDLSCNGHKTEVKLEKEKIGADLPVKRRVKNLIDLLD